MTEPQRLYSVTTLISEGVPKPALLAWVGRTVAEYAVEHVDEWSPLAKGDPDAAVKVLIDSRYRSTKKAADRGTAVHAEVEKIALGLADGQILEGGHMEQYYRFLADHSPEFLAAEASVVNLTYGYAGTLDNLVRIGDGPVCVLDVKTTDKGPDAKSRPPYPEVALQLAAYARAEWIGLKPFPREEGRYSRRYYYWTAEHPQAKMIKVEGGLCLMLSPFDYELVPIRIDDEVFTAFLYVREVARWQLETSKRVLGPPITAQGRIAV